MVIRKDICKNGHVISKVGRSSVRKCNGCYAPVRLGLKSRKKKQFCKQNHDTFQVGRDKQGGCNDCRKSYKSKPYRIKAFRESNWKSHKIINKNGSTFSLLDYDRLYQIQQGRCRICKTHQSELKRRLAVDHNHETGFVRGLLCDYCNRFVLPVVEKHEELVPRAQNYLKEHQEVI